MTGKAEDWDNRAKLAVIIETTSMNAVELSTYCREKGLYAEQIEDWKLKFIQSTGNSSEQASVSKAALASERKKAKR